MTGEELFERWLRAGGPAYSLWDNLTTRTKAAWTATAKELTPMDVDPFMGASVLVCNLCGQALDQGQECNSSFHVGPDGRLRGRGVSSVELVLGLRDGVSL